MATSLNQRLTSVANKFDATALQRTAAAKDVSGSSSQAARIGAAAAVGLTVTSKEKEKGALPSPCTVRGWSETEQKLLEAGLKLHPASLKEERWAKIASSLPGRSPEECKKRFKAIAKALKEKKKAKTE